MDPVKYDIERLRGSKEIDMTSALLNFREEQDFFDVLRDFATNSAEYLSEFSPYKVATRDEARKEFLLELKKLRDMFVSLGMNHAASDLKYLENATIQKNEDLLKKEIAELHDRMKRIRRQILAAEISAEPSPAPSPAGKKPLILAVDDVPSLLSSVVKMLGDHYTVMAVTSGKAVSKVLEKHTPALFLLDIEMPLMNGYEVAAYIRQQPKFAQTPIVFLTAKSRRDDVITAVKYGGNDFLVKPVDKERLLSKIKQFLP